MPAPTLGRYGFSIDVKPDDRYLAGALTIEGLGFGTLWINGGGLDRLERLTDLLSSTRTATVGSAIVPPDAYSAAEVSALYEQAEARAPGRLVLGLGSPHQPGALELLRTYVGDLVGVPQDRRLLAALGPRALALARDDFAGAMPMLFTAQRTADARRIVGADRTLTVGLYVVLDEDPDRARATAREPLGFLTTMPAYRRSLTRQGFSAGDIADLSDRLVDTLVAWGGPGDVVDRADRLLDVGADHVQLTVLGSGGQPTGVDAARLLAGAIG